MNADNTEVTTWSFAHTIWVQCPSCRRMGCVESEIGQGTFGVPLTVPAKFRCSGCGAHARSAEKWFGRYLGHLHRPCQFCGSILTHQTGPVAQPERTTPVNCGGCGREESYELHWNRFDKDPLKDPFFGLPLWLTTDFKGHSMWFYNLEHLHYVKSYIASPLRSGGSRGKYSLVANLPGWMTAAKHRDGVVQRLEKLARDFEKSQMNRK